MPWPLCIECRRSRPAALRWRPRPTPPSPSSLFSAKQQLIDKGWLAKVNTVLGRHGLVADLDIKVVRKYNSSSGTTSEVSHAESLLRVLIDACHANANPGGSVMLRNDT